MIDASAGEALLRCARRVLQAHFAGAEDADASDVDVCEAVGGVFATLKKHGDLRGCVGYVVSTVDLTATTKRAVVAAATNDPRFSPVTADELPEITIGISVLSESVRVRDIDEIEIGRDGLVIEREGVRGLLLPQVATERGWDRERFLAETCVKAGLPPESWIDKDTTILRFTATSFDERDVNEGYDR